MAPRRLAGRLGDDADVAVEEPQLVVVARHQNRPADVPGAVEAEPIVRGEQPLDLGVDGLDPARPAAVRAEHAEAVERRAAAARGVLAA